MKRHKIILYNPQAEFYTMPLALLTIASALDPQEYDVRIVDGRLEERPLHTVLHGIDGALCLGISVLTGAPIHDALKVTRAVKAKYPELPIIWGGWHPSLFPLETLAEPTIDITVQGQGEVTFAELVRYLAQQLPLNDVHGISVRVNGKPKQHPPRALTDLNVLPPANYGLLAVEQYFQRKGKRQLDYISSLGCYSRCAFCADPFVYHHKRVALEPERICDDLERLWQQYHFDDVSFQDETFFARPQKVVVMAESLLENHRKFTWAATMRADQGGRLSDEMFACLVRSGLRRVIIGVESGSQRVLEKLKKHIRLEQVLDCAEKCKRHGIRVIFPFIVGLPKETESDLWATIDLVKRLQTMSPTFETPIFYFKPYPGSELTRKVVQNGYRLPKTLTEWAEFDYVGSTSPWLGPTWYARVEQLNMQRRLT